MTEMELVRNDDLTFSALKLLVELPWVELAGKFRLYDKYKDFNIGFCFCNNGVYCLIDSGTMFMCSAFSPQRTAREQSMPRSLVSRHVHTYWRPYIYVFIIYTQVELVVVLDTKKTFDEQAQSQIGIKHFNVRKSLAKYL